jgi:hypothetical protein
MANTKMTKKDVVEMMMVDDAIKTNEVYMGYLKHEMELLKKKSTNRKPTKSQKDNEDIKTALLAALTDKGQTVTELQKASDYLGGFSNQKLSALLRLMVLDGVVDKKMDGKKALFKVA